MATRYEVRTFGDIVRAVLETLKVQASDTESVNRIKRNINMVYLNHVVPASNSWNWLNNTTTVTVEPYFAAGTASVQQNLTLVQLIQTPATSQEGKFFSVDDGCELYRIASHTVGDDFFYLESPYSGTTNTAASFKIWTDKVVLPSDCMKVKEVITTNATKPLDPVSLQQFRKHQISGGALVGSPSFYCEGGLEEPAPYTDIADLPALVSTTSAGLYKTLTFAADVADYLSVGDRIHVVHNDQYTYTGDFIVSGIDGVDLTYTGRLPFNEEANTDVSALSIQLVATTNTDPAPTLLVYPAIQQSNRRINLVVDYQMYPSELIADRDEPLIPREHRSVLFYGAMWLSSDRETDIDRADRYKVLCDLEVQKMLQRASATPKTPTMRVSNSYLRTKSGLFGRSARYTAGMEPFGSAPSANAPTATGTPNSVAIFDANGLLIGSPDIDLDLLSYLIGTQATGSVPVDNNATTTIDAWEVDLYKSAEIQYVIKRGTTYRSGHLVVATDGSTVNYSDSGPLEIGETGAEWTADLIAGTFRVQVTLDDQAVGGTVYYKVSLV